MTSTGGRQARLGRGPAVPLVDLAAAHRELETALRAGFDQVIERGVFVSGPEVAAFEEEFARYCGVSHCVGVSNGTEALALLLSSLGIGPGDEVVTTSFTFVATIEAILRTGARPVLVDVTADGQNLDPALVAEAITSRTRAVVAVHLYGRLADTAQLAAVAEKAGVELMEDAAQAHGARDVAGRRAGAFGRAASFSFYPAKNLGAMGDGGAITTSDPDLAAALRVRRDHGRTNKHHHELVGWNARLDELQAAILRVKLACLDEWNERRRVAAARYGELLADVPGLALPTPDPGEVFHVYGVRSAKRDELAGSLAEEGIETGMHYAVPVHQQPAFAELFAGCAFPHAERWAATELSLPMHPHLTSETQERVADVVRATFGV